MNLRVYNTLSGAKEPFEPLEPGEVRMYVCGVTVYDYCHVGHARAGIVFDTIYRYLQHRGYKVTYVRNFTDIDDKIINKAAAENVPWTEITRRYIKAFYQDMGQLNIEAPDVEPKATGHIEDMKGMVQSLLEKGKAYEVDGDVFFAVRTFEGYGRLSGKNIDDLQSGARVEVDPRKRDPLDFALWKKSKPDEPAWDSPWGPGRPGWHIECSAMSHRYLGETFDIHGGGKDLVFPHHENEIAQSEGCTGKPFVKYWVHNGFVNINQEKMSKSLGNFFTIRDLLTRYHPEVLRLFLLTNHYRGPIDFADSYLEETEKVLDRFYELLGWVEEHPPTLQPTGNAPEPPRAPFYSKFEDAMDDDFNTALALGHMNEELRRLNKLRSELPPQDAGWTAFARDAAALQACGRILGIFHRSPADYRSEQFQLKNRERNLDVPKIEALISDRTTARKSRDWAAADRLRDELLQMGVLLEDTPEGTTWSVR
ncbi:MAG: cysteine--tRNA ligase [Nitrospinaceae bacterium]